MADHSSYNLIQAVDPRKINVPINDRFAKLTLSSNKKNPVDVKRLDKEKRQNASRNLMEQLSSLQLNSENSILSENKSLTNGTDNEVSYMEPLHITESSAQRSPDILSYNQKLNILNDQVICVSSESSLVGTEDIEQLTEEEEDVITVSDSSHCKSDPNEMLTSNLVLSNVAEGEFRSKNIDDEKAKRIAAFLHDISMERKKTANQINDATENSFFDRSSLKMKLKQKEIPEQVQEIVTADTEAIRRESNFNVETPATEGQLKQYIKASEQMNENASSSTYGFDQIALKMKSRGIEIGTKAHKVATADTESMTREENFNIPVSNFDNERGNRIKTLDNTVSMTSDDYFSSFEVTSDKSTNQERFNECTAYSLSNENNVTPFNKTNNPNDYSVIEESVNISSSENNWQSSDESVIISETDDETDNHQPRLSKRYNNKTLKSSSKLSNQNKTDGASESSDSVEGVYEISNKLASINISAKINIKIHVPSDSSNASDIENTIPITESSTESDIYKSNYGIENKKTNTPKNVNNGNEALLPESERLLTELYGNSWQTPEVLRTLQRANRQKSNDTVLKKTTAQGEERSNCYYYKTHVEKNKSNIAEESTLGDFATFHRNICTNLNSTGVTAPKISSNTAIVSKRKDKVEEKKKSESWRKCLNYDNDPEYLDNASDDENPDKTEIDESLTNYKMKNNSMMITPINIEINKQIRHTTKDDEIIYLDLSKHEVEVQEEIAQSPPVDTDKKFISRLEEILHTCRPSEKTKLPCTPQSSKTKRKLFTPYYDDCEQIENVFEKQTPLNKVKVILNDDEEVLDDIEIDPFDKRGIPKRLPLINKQLESVKSGKSIFEMTPQKFNTPKTPKNSEQICHPVAFNSTSKPKSLSQLKQKLISTVPHKHPFLKSLNASVSKCFCHPEALIYRENYRTQKQDLSRLLYDLFNEKVFNNKLEVQMTWNKRLSSTAGRCFNKKKAGIRLCSIELSDKVLTSADRLRCTLIHEMCHAATWIFDAEKGHGATWKRWARRANAIFPELPKIDVCHQYDIEYKYTYKCCLCDAKSYAHSTSRKVENIRCSYCHGAIEVFLNKKDKGGNVIHTPLREPTGFAKFVKENYKTYKQDDRKHSEIMKILSIEFAALKVNQNK
uniref:SprT-like domain-containing protein n=1 Tax=Glossina brevipalpis TaxID=37001 RepID=A0A1A9W9Z7_9MUSC